MSKSPRRSEPARGEGPARGKLRIGSDWNAITIIAMSQSNPLKAIAELVENSIDAGARSIVITRGREQGNHFLSIRDDGAGVPRNESGTPDFHYVATHICDSVKRHLKSNGVAGLQGEFGIGLLSFWTIGEELTMTSTGADQRAYQMTMRKGDPAYTVAAKRTLFEEQGTEVRISPLLEGLRAITGEKVQWYLSSELRDRIRTTAVKIQVIDRVARKQYLVEPRVYEGRLLHRLPQIACALGDVYAEIYIGEPSQANHVSLFRRGTRVLEAIDQLDDFAHPPWSLGYLQGLIDAPFLTLTPGTRSGLLHDESYAALMETLRPLATRLSEIIDEQRRAEEEQASKELLKTIQRAFREALLALPAEEYDWFEIQARSRRLGPQAGGTGEASGFADRVAEAETLGVEEPELPADGQRAFFHFAGPLFQVAIAPASSVVQAGQRRRLVALPRDRARRRVEDDLTFAWEVLEGAGDLEGAQNQSVTFVAPEEPGLVQVRVTVTQRDVRVQATALVTVTHEFPYAATPTTLSTQGLPGYTFERAPGAMWRSRFDAARNLIVVNSGHRDFVYATKSKSLKVKYLVRLYSKELVLRNFSGMAPDQLLERMVELSLRTEEHL